jgi:hypothetical protein
MKRLFSLESFLGVLIVFVLTISFSGCSEEQALPSGDQQVEEVKITFRTIGPVSTSLVKKKVSERDNIPLEEILTCTFTCETPEGFWKYSLTTLNNGPKIYIVTQIIGDDCDGA